MRSGFEVVAEAIGLRAQIAAADLVITGEGKLDEQTLTGKAPEGVARIARAVGKPVFAIAGQASGDWRGIFDQVFVLMKPPLTEAQAIARAPELLRERAREAARFFISRASG
jgi:glycerate 2-kinase